MFLGKIRALFRYSGRQDLEISLHVLPGFQGGRDVVSPVFIEYKIVVAFADVRCFPVWF